MSFCAQGSVSRALEMWHLHPILTEHKNCETSFAVFTTEPFPLDTWLFPVKYFQEVSVLPKRNVWTALEPFGAVLLGNDFCRTYHPGCFAIFFFFSSLNWNLLLKTDFTFFMTFCLICIFLHQTQSGRLFPRVAYSFVVSRNDVWICVYLYIQNCSRCLWLFSSTCCHSYVHNHK